jgi:hypothetical protein
MDTVNLPKLRVMGGMVTSEKMVTLYSINEWATYWRVDEIAKRYADMPAKWYATDEGSNYADQFLLVHVEDK